ncbi:MAG: TRAP transporter small permease [Gammaproteobacteria bacterium]|jgi:C4-dicarboxylate transporter DctQ subunit
MALALAFMTIITFVQVVLRYVFGTGLVWSLEATTYTFAWLVLIGMSYGVRTRAHIAVDLFSNRLSYSARRAMAVIVAGLCFLYCGFMIYGSAIFIDGLFTLGNNARDIPLPRWLLTGIMPIAFSLLAFRFLQAARRVLIRGALDPHLKKHGSPVAIGEEQKIKPSERL